MEEQSKTLAIVELMGHRKMAGVVSMDQSFGPALTRVDVPETAKHPAFTQHFGAAAIYAITACSEETARAFNEMHRYQPIDEWNARAMIEKVDRAKALPAPEVDDEDDDCYMDEEGFYPLVVLAARWPGYTTCFGLGALLGMLLADLWPV